VPAAWSGRLAAASFASRPPPVIRSACEEPALSGAEGTLQSKSPDA